MYDKILLMGDFNAPPHNITMKSFCETNNFKNLVKDPTCFKNATSPSCIDLFLKNSAKSFQNTTNVETGLSDFHKLIVTVLKVHFDKQNPRIVKYRNIKRFSNEAFCQDLINELNNYDINNIELTTFTNVCNKILNLHASLKSTYLRANHSNFVSKKLRTAIMTRSKLRNKFLKNKTSINGQKYKKQRNRCVALLKEEKKNYFENLNVKLVQDNRKFRKSVCPLFSNKLKTKDKIALIENDNFCVK